MADEQQRPSTVRRDTPEKKRYRATGGVRSARDLQAEQDSSLGPDATDEEKKLVAGHSVTTHVTDKQVNPRVKTILRDLFGADKHGNVDTAAAAEAAGVNRRTIQRWLKEPPENSERLEAIKKQWQESKHGRRRRVSTARRQQLKGGGQLMIKTAVDISHDKRNGEVRRNAFVVTYGPEQGQELYEAMLNGDKEAYEALQAIVGSHFGTKEGSGVAFTFNDIRWVQ